jgi:hypothetical protein
MGHRLNAKGSLAKMLTPAAVRRQSMNPGVMVINNLVLMGYRPLLEGKEIILKWEGQGQPDPSQVRLLVGQVWKYKSEVIAYLSAKPQASPERILTCFECDHFRPAVNSPNPAQAWGHCEKRNKGRYGVAVACEAILTSPDAVEVEV